MNMLSKITFQEINPWLVQALTDILTSASNNGSSYMHIYKLDVNANAGVGFLSILFNGTSVKTLIVPELQFLLIYLKTTFTNYLWVSVVVWFCCLFKCHDLLKSINVFGYTVCLEARGGLVKVIKVRIRVRILRISGKG